MLALDDDEATTFEPPLCSAVWNPAAPPAVASATVIGTVAYLDSVGYFSGGNGPVLGGTTPWAVYLQVAIASTLGALDGSSTPAQTQCLATFEIAQGGTNGFAAVLQAEAGKGICEHPYVHSRAVEQPFFIRVPPSRAREAILPTH